MGQKMKLLSLKVKAGIGIIAIILLTTTPGGTDFYSLQKNKDNTSSPPHSSSTPTQASHAYRITLSA